MGLRDPVPSDSLRAFLTAATTRYQKSLSDDAVEYLTEERGLTQEIIETFRLGYVSDPLPGHEHLRGKIAIPYLSPAGLVGTIRFRSLDSVGPKYLSVANDTPRLYNVSALELPVTGIVLTEGEIDAMTAHQCGFPAVGIPGASSWQPVWCRLLIQYNVVYLLHDDDKAGSDMAKAIAAQLDNVRPIPMDGGDVNSFVKEHGPNGLKEKLTRK